MKKTISRYIERPYIWLKRFRKRKGYGVHSPFAFSFITKVVYDTKINDECRTIIKKEKNANNKGYEKSKVKKLLYRLTKHFNPTRIIDVGYESFSKEYIKAAIENKAEYNFYNLQEYKKVEMYDMAYVHAYNNVEEIEQIIENLIEVAHDNSVLIIEGVGYNNAMKRLWKKIITDNVGVNFDLYDVGIVMFNKKITKQDYVVNF